MANVDRKIVDRVARAAEMEESLPDLGEEGMAERDQKILCKRWSMQAEIGQECPLETSSNRIAF